MRRLIFLGLLLVGATACTYENPYAQEDAQNAARAAQAINPPDVVLDVTYLASALPDDSQAYAPAIEFKVGQPIYLTVVLKGTGKAKVQGFLKASELDRKVIAVVEREFPVESRGSFTIPSGFELAPGSYYVSVVIDDVPSWGLPFTVSP